jgi:hypothetical protein
MGLLNQIIGAVVAEEAVEKLDPEAGFFKKGLAAIAGFEGEKVIEEKIDEHIAARDDSTPTT